MKILVDINHPAHVHYFKNSINILRQKGHEIVISYRDRPPIPDLLGELGEKSYNRGKGSRKILGKLFTIFLADLRLLRYSLREKPDLYLSFGTPYPNHIAWLRRKPAINFQDTENARLMFAISLPFSTLYCTPSCFKRDLGKKQIRFDGYMELSHLHPNYFSPDASILKELKLKEGERYVILRFVDWQASHDLGHQGISLENKRRIVRTLSQHIRVFISAECQLPDDLQPYQITIPPHRMHDLMAFSSLLYGESATMASESAVLGVPAIYLDNCGRGYTDEQESRYGLVFNFTESQTDQERSLKKALELITQGDNRPIWQKKRTQLLSDTIDVTAFMTWLIDRYPHSLEEIRRNPNAGNPFRKLEP